MQQVTRGGAGCTRQRQSNSPHIVFHVQCFMPSRGDCLSAACARWLARKGRGVQPQPLLVVAGLMLAVAQARVHILFEPLVFFFSKSWSTGSEGLGCTTPTPPVCRLDVGSGTRELAKPSADKARVVIGVLGG